MQNILLVLDGTEPNSNATDFACFIASLTHSNLHAIFIQNIKGEDQPALKNLFALPYVETITARDFPENKQHEDARTELEKIFTTTCMNRGINQRISYNRKAEVREVLTESRFADLIILDPQTSFSKSDDGTPSGFVKEILTGAECPVILTPYSFSAIDELIFTYDGSRSSVYAIRQFANMFSKLASKKLTVLQIDESAGSKIDEKEKLEALLNCHFSKVVYRQFIGSPGDEMFEYLLGKENAFVIMGAYGKGPLSNPFRHSRADLLVKTINLPLFTAHH